MRRIPKEMQEFTLDVALGITNASEANDDVLMASLYERLAAYCQDLRQRGALHPAVLETLADFTDDPVVAVSLYREALAITASDEPKHTILIFMAYTLVRLGEIEKAKECLINARDEASHWQDEYYFQEANAAFNELTTTGSIELA